MSGGDRREDGSHGRRRIGVYQSFGQRIFVYFLLETSVGRLTVLLALVTISVSLLRRVYAGNAAITVWIMALVFCAISVWAGLLIWSTRGRPPQDPNGLIATPLGYGVLTSIMVVASFFAILAGAGTSDPILWAFATGLCAITLLSIRTAWRAMADGDEGSR